MMYDIIDSPHRYEGTVNFFTIGNLIELALNHPEKNFRFVGTKLTVGDLHSWRGSYNLAAISYEDGTKTGRQIATELLDAIKEVHYGWKGGEYYYDRSDQFYIAKPGSSTEHKVVGWEWDESSDEIVLLTKLDPY